MSRRQTMPRQWLIAHARNEREPWTAMHALPRRSGVLALLHDLSPSERQKVLRQLRRRAAAKALWIVDEGAGRVARVHNLQELRRALLRRKPYILLSPLYPTGSHPGWRPIPRMRSAAYARLAGRRLIALGGMDERRFRRVQPLGFVSWAAISAFRT